MEARDDRRGILDHDLYTGRWLKTDQQLDGEFCDLRRRVLFEQSDHASAEFGGVNNPNAPEEIDLTHPLAGVMGATNALTISTDTLGDVTIVGPGAGRKETGYSALIDIIHAGGSR